jgi:hypothetical protein
MYVNNIHSFILLPSIVLSFIQLIHIDLLFEDEGIAGDAPTTEAHTSNSRGIGRIPDEEGHRSKRRVEDEE